MFQCFYSIFKLLLALMAQVVLVCRKTANKQTNRGKFLSKKVLLFSIVYTKSYKQTSAKLVGRRTLIHNVSVGNEEYGLVELQYFFLLMK